MKSTYSGLNTMGAPGTLWRKFVSIRGEMAWIIFGQAAVASGGILGVRLLTHWLPPDSYGQLALGLTLTTLIQQSLLSPFSGAALRFFSNARETGEFGSFAVAVKRILRGLVGAVVGIVLVGITVGILRGKAEFVPMMIWCAVFAQFSSFSAILDGMQVAARQRAVVAWHAGVGTWLRFLLGAIAVMLFGPSATFAIMGYAVAAILVCGSQYLFFRRSFVQYQTDLPDEVRVKKWRNMIYSYSWPFTAWGLFVWAQSASERWSLQVFGTSAQVGQYAVLFQLGYYPIVMIGGMAMQLISPIIFNHAGNGVDVENVARCRRMASNLAFVCLAVTLLISTLAHLLAPNVFAWIVPETYWSATFLLPWMVLAGGFFTAGQFASLAIMSEQSPQSLIRPKIVTALVAIGFNVTGAYLHGLRGVVMAGVLFSIIYAIWMIGLASDMRVDALVAYWARVMRGIHARMRGAIQVYLFRNPVAIANRRWFKEKADQSLRINYPLSDSSVVFDLGGYHGDWSSHIYSKYSPSIYIFEPVSEYAELIRRRFGAEAKIRVFNFGLGPANSEIILNLAEDSSSAFRSPGSLLEKVRICDITAFLTAENIARVDLIKINIEGGEFELLRRMLDAGIVSKFINLQIQFHEFVPNAWSLRNSIRHELSKTHKLTYDFPFVWENWRKRDE